MSGFPTAETTVVGDIVNLALRDANVIGEGQPASNTQIRDAFFKLNWMIAQWRRKRIFVYDTIDVSWVANGNISFTLGPNGDINIPYRPNKVNAAFLRQLYQTGAGLDVDYPLVILQDRRDYNNISLKSLSTFSKYLFYDPAYPLGVAYPWPVPSPNIYEIHLMIYVEIGQFTSVNQSINLPGEYAEAIQTNLAVRLAIQNGLVVRPELMGMATQSIRTLSIGNTQVPRLRMPTYMSGRGGIYNPYSDQVT